MELSVRSPAPAAVSSMPVLRVWPTERLLLHEEADAGRVRRLADALRRDGVLRNPPVVALLPATARSARGGTARDEGRAVVLDGANRVTALQVLGLPHVVVQLVSYDDPAIGLSVWRHYVVEAGPGGLRAAAATAGLGSIVPAAGERDAESQLTAADGLAAIVDAGGAVVIRRDGSAAETAAALRRLAALYRDGSLVHRIDTGGLDELQAAYGIGALVLFRQFEKPEILDLALEGERLPAGITRHVIPGRALRLNTPVAWLADGIDRSVKQAVLDAQLQQRRQAHAVRHYAEPVFLFDE